MKTAKIIVSLVLGAASVVLVVISCLGHIVMTGTWVYERYDYDSDSQFTHTLEADTKKNIISTQSFDGDEFRDAFYYSTDGKDITFFRFDGDGETYKFDLKENRFIIYEREYGDEDHARIYKRTGGLSLAWTLRLVAIGLDIVMFIVIFAVRPKKKRAVKAPPEKAPPLTNTAPDLLFEAGSLGDDSAPPAVPYSQEPQYRPYAPPPQYQPYQAPPQYGQYPPPTYAPPPQYPYSQPPQYGYNPGAIDINKK